MAPTAIPNARHAAMPKPKDVSTDASKQLLNTPDTEQLAAGPDEQLVLKSIPPKTTKPKTSTVLPGKQT